MNKIKRISSTILAVILMMATLTGCGANELGYYKLLTEPSNLTEYNFESKISFELGQQLADKAYNLDLIFEGVANSEDLNSLYMDANILMNLNKTKLKNKVNLKIADNKVYVSKNVLGAFLEVTEVLGKMDDSYIVNEKVVEELYNNNLKDVDYILLADLETLYKDVLYKGTTNIQYTKINDIGRDYLNKIFNGFDSKIFKKTSNGYAMELDVDGVLSFAENLLDYIYENKETVFDETVKYLEELHSLINLDEITEEDMELFIEELKDLRQDFFDGINVALFFIRSEDVKGKLDFIKGSKISSEIQKEGKSYISNANFEMVFKNERIYNITSESKITPANVEVARFTGKAIKGDEFEKLYNEIEDRINPIEGLKISWFQGDEFANAYKIRALEGNEELSLQPYAMREGRMYLPLSYVSETLGEEVEWDDLNHKAYIVRGTEKIDMTGIIVNSKTMVKIRDFEKLGYEIEYETGGLYSIATIKKTTK